jgi:hypothetical protein
MESKLTITIDPSLQYQYIETKDCGSTCCPHCGAEGRYIYTWAEFGVIKSAMAGCFAALTGKMKMGDTDSFIQKLSVKLAKNKPLNGWDKTVLRMQQYIVDNPNDEGKKAWAKAKIAEAVRECKMYAFKKFK